jgi:Domain of unknown function (DUF4159)
MRCLFRAGAAVAATVVILSGCGGEATHEGPYVVPIGGELMTQQAPPPNIDRSIFKDPRHPPLSSYGEIARTAGRWPFYWTRAVYSPNGLRGRDSWLIDGPKSDRQFLIVLKRLVRINAYDWENFVSLADPNLRKFPLLYMLEVGGMDMTEAEVKGLRGYLDAGGFVIVDDFWGQDQWAVFEYNMRRVYPNRTFVDLSLDNPVFSAYYTIDHIEMTPAINNTVRKTECPWDPLCYTQVKGLYDDKGRLMMIVNWNTDLGDAWEWAEDPSYPLNLSTYAFEMGTNMVVYAMTH